MFRAARARAAAAHNNIKRLTGRWNGCWRYRVGDWRVLYRIIEELKRVHVFIIAHRRDIYD
jgi:mRNA interferase RelE/StbE